MTRYLHIREDGTVMGHYANPQPGYAELEVADDDPRIAAWRQERESQRDAAKAAARQQSQAKEDALLARISALEEKLAQLEKPQP